MFLKKDNNPTSSSSNTRSLSYRKQVIDQRATSKIKQGFFNVSTNITYKVGGGFNMLKSFFSRDSKKQYQVICLHGRKFTSEAEALEYLRQLIWFSYRRIPGLCQQYHSDTGWGCLIRVGQMALAAGLKEYFSQKTNQRKTQKSVVMSSIIVAFVQKGGKNEKYSLQKIVERASRKFKLNYGKWFNTIQICQVLTYLHNRNPMKGSQNLVLVHFKQSTIFLDQVFRSFNKNMCSCKKLRICCPLCNHVQIFRQQTRPIQTMLSRTMTQKTNKFQNEKLIKSQIPMKRGGPEKKLLIFVSCRLGMQKINQLQYKQLIDLLGLPCSLGIVGGVPKRGYYFVGYDDDKLIYMDPHLVQDQITLSNIELKLKQFEFNQLRKVKREQIDPQMAFVFYIDNLDALNKLHTKCEQMKQNYDNPIISVEWVNQYNRGNFSKIEETEEEGLNSLENSFIEEL